VARSTVETIVTQSVLDRLTTVEDWPSTRSQSVQYFRDAIKRDLEWLLNTRQPGMRELEGYPLANASMVNYGLPDISALGLSSASDQRRLRLAIQACLKNFEPRLMNIEVTIEGSDVSDRRLRFHIEGQMRLDPAPEEISFDTVLELTSGEYRMK
jgi:type VI secretion system protein ImpF